jgi:hypothetical protein
MEGVLVNDENATRETWWRGGYFICKYNMYQAVLYQKRRAEHPRGVAEGVAYDRGQELIRE